MLEAARSTWNNGGREGKSPCAGRRIGHRDRVFDAGFKSLKYGTTPKWLVQSV